MLEKLSVGIAALQLLVSVALLVVVVKVVGGTTSDGWPAPIRTAHQASQWEYTIEGIPDAKWQESAKLLGDAGWELVFARRASDADDAMLYECIFRRPAKYGLVGDEVHE